MGNCDFIGVSIFREAGYITTEGSVNVGVAFEPPMVIYADISFKEL